MAFDPGAFLELIKGFFAPSRHSAADTFLELPPLKIPKLPAIAATTLELNNPESLAAKRQASVVWLRALFYNIQTNALYKKNADCAAQEELIAKSNAFLEMLEKNAMNRYKKRLENLEEHDKEIQTFWEKEEKQQQKNAEKNEPKINPELLKRGEFKKNLSK